jgi:acyl-CoA dehydrogenase
LFDRYGVIRVETLDEFAATLLLLSSQRRVARGGLVAIDDSGGERELLIDLADRAGVPFAALSQQTKASIAARLDPGLEAANPLDAWGTGADFVAQFTHCLGDLLADPEAGLGLFNVDIRDGSYLYRGFADAALAAARASPKIVAGSTNYTQVRHEALALELTLAGVPVLDGTSNALAAIGGAFAYRDFQARPFDPPPLPPPASAGDRQRARARLRTDAGALDEGRAFRCWKPGACPPSRIAWSRVSRKPDRRPMRSAIPSPARRRRRGSCTNPMSAACASASPTSTLCAKPMGNWRRAGAIWSREGAPAARWPQAASPAWRILRRRRRRSGSPERGRRFVFRVCRGPRRCRRGDRRQPARRARRPHHRQTRERLMDLSLPSEALAWLRSAVREHGLNGVNHSREVGGQGCSQLELTLIAEELGKATGALWAIVPHPAVALKHGTPEQIETYLRPSCLMERRACVAVTEPDAGSDPRMVRMRADRRDGGFILNREKWFVTSGDDPDYIIVHANVDGDPDKPTLFLVDKASPGVRIAREPKFTHTYVFGHPEFVFENVEVAENRVLGPIGGGSELTKDWFVEARLQIAANTLGAAIRAFELANAWASERRQFGRAIRDFQAIEFMLADMAVEIMATKSLVYRVSWEIDAGVDRKLVHAHASVLKLQASEMAGRVLDKAVQIFGGRGYMRENAVQRLNREVRVDRIWEGTSEIQRVVIGGQMRKRGTSVFTRWN